MKNDFYGDVWYLLKYNIWWTIALMGFCGGLWYYHGGFPAPEIAMSWEWMLLVPLGIASSMYSFGSLHNASHGNYSSRWLNKLMGEIMGFHQIWGYEGWKWLHIFHHRHTDTPQDPHAPKKGDKFLGYCRAYIKASIEYLIIVRMDILTKRGYEGWKAVMAKQSFSWSIRFSMAFRLLAIWMVSPSFFVWFLIPSQISQILITSYINYYGHQYLGDDERSTAMDLHGALLSDTFNFLGHNSCYHGSHHSNPNVFDPKTVHDAKKAEALAKAQASNQSEPTRMAS